MSAGRPETPEKTHHPGDHPCSQPHRRSHSCRTCPGRIAQSGGVGWGGPPTPAIHTCGRRNGARRVILGAPPLSDRLFWEHRSLSKELARNRRRPGVAPARKTAPERLRNIRKPPQPSRIPLVPISPPPVDSCAVMTRSTCPFVDAPPPPPRASSALGGVGCSHRQSRRAAGAHTGAGRVVDCLPETPAIAAGRLKALSCAPRRAAHTILPCIKRA